MVDGYEKRSVDDTGTKSKSSTVTPLVCMDAFLAYQIGMVLLLNFTALRMCVKGHGLLASISAIVELGKYLMGERH